MPHERPNVPVLTCRYSIVKVSSCQVNNHRHSRVVCSVGVDVVRSRTGRQGRHGHFGTVIASTIGGEEPKERLAYCQRSHHFLWRHDEKALSHSTRFALAWPDPGGLCVTVYSRPARSAGLSESRSAGTSEIRSTGPSESPSTGFSESRRVSRARAYSQPRPYTDYET